MIPSRRPRWLLGRVSSSDSSSSEDEDDEVSIDNAVDLRLVACDRV